MGFFKALSLAFLLFISGSSKAADFFLGGGLSFTGVISEEDYYNGATGIFPNVTASVGNEMFKLDGFFRIGTLSNEHNGYQIEMDTSQFGFIVKYYTQQWVTINLGYHWTSVEAEADIVNNEMLTGLLNSTMSSIILGLGLDIAFTDMWSVRSDFNYYLGDEEFNTLQIDFAVVYKLATF